MNALKTWLTVFLFVALTLGRPISSSAAFLTQPENSELQDGERLLLQAEALYEEGEWAAAITMFEQAAQAFERQAQPSDQAYCYFSIGLSYIALEEPTEAIAALETAADLYHTAGEPAGEAFALSVVAAIYYEQQQFADAVPYAQQAAALFETAGESNAAAYAHQQLADAYNALGEYPDAARHYEEALALLTGQDQPETNAAIHKKLGALYEQLDEEQRALEHYQSALILFRELDDKDAVLETAVAIGDLYYNLSQFRAALPYFEEALLLWQALDDPTAEAAMTGRIGQVYRWRGEYEQALVYYERALVLFQESNDPFNQTVTYNYIGDVYREQERYPEALDAYEEGIRIAEEELDSPDAVAVHLDDMAQVYVELEQYQTAINTFRRALDIVSRQDSPAKSHLLYSIGHAYVQMAQWEDAAATLQDALALYEQLRDEQGMADTLDQLGAVYLAQEQYAEAISVYEQALALNEKLKRGWNAAKTYEALGNVKTAMGEAAEASDDYRRAARLYTELGRALLTDAHYEASQISSQEALSLYTLTGAITETVAPLVNLGTVYAALADYTSAREHYDNALEVAQAHDYLLGIAHAENGRGNLARLLGQPEIALGHFEQALAAYEAQEDEVDAKAYILMNLGIVLVELGPEHRKFDQALDYLQEALLRFEAQGDQLGQASALNNLGGYYNTLSDHATAQAYYDQAVQLYQAGGDRQGEANSLHNSAAMDAYLGQEGQALSKFQEALEIFQELGALMDQAPTLMWLAQLHETQGNISEAIRLYTESIQLIERIHNTLSIHPDPRRQPDAISFAASQITSYRRLSNLLWENGAQVEAFHFTERARTRVFFNQLASGAVEVGDAGDLVVQERSLKDQIAAHNAELVLLRNRPEPERDHPRIAAIEAQIEALEDEHTLLCEQIRFKDPEHAALVCGNFSSLAEIQSSLDTQTTLVSYFVMPERTLAFVVTQDDFVARELGVTEEQLRTQVIDRFRLEDLQYTDSPWSSLDPLYDWLVAPIEDLLTTPVMGIIPHSVLHYLPFAALSDGTTYLGERYTLFTVPSASSLRFIADKYKREAGQSALVLGNPTLDLSVVEEQAEAVAGLYGAAPLLRQRATESAVKDGAGQATVLHLAAHGVFDREDPLNTAIQLAQDAKNDGWLRVSEIYGLNLNQRTNLVVLSACESAVNDLRAEEHIMVSAGDEIVSLSRAFIYAGAPAVVASLWKVQAASTTELMEHFYRYLVSGVGAAQALQQAQTKVRETYPHPYHWAGFVITGDPGLVEP